MIGCKEIQKAVSGLLKKGSFLVLARESVEGGKRPACSVDVFPASAERLNNYMEQDTFSVEIIYYPKTETQENLADTADKLKPLLLLCPLEIENRTIHTYNVSFSKLDTALIAECDYTLEQAIDVDRLHDEFNNELMNDLMNDIDIMIGIGEL